MYSIEIYENCFGISPVFINEFQLKKGELRACKIVNWEKFVMFCDIVKAYHGYINLEMDTMLFSYEDLTNKELLKLVRKYKLETIS